MRLCVNLRYGQFLHLTLIDKIEVKYQFCICFLSIGLIGSSQVENPYTWEVSNKKMTAGQYEISFYTGSETSFILYAPNQIFDGYHTVELKFGASSVVVDMEFKTSGSR